jgi:hypothetical protein
MSKNKNIYRYCRVTRSALYQNERENLHLAMLNDLKRFSFNIYLRVSKAVGEKPYFHDIETHELGA